MTDRAFTGVHPPVADPSAAATTEPHRTVLARVTPMAPVLTVAMGVRRGQRMPISHEPLTIGRGADCAFRIDDALASRVHCQLCVRDQRLWIEDLGSTNGTFVGNRAVAKVALDIGDFFTVGETVFKVTGQERLAARWHRDAGPQPPTHPLHGIADRRMFRDRLDREIGLQHGAAARALSLAIVNLDHFGRFNAAHGDLAGNTSLRALYTMLSGALNTDGLVARLDRDEFVVLLIGCSPTFAAGWVDYVRRRFRHFSLLHPEHPWRMSFSAGVAQWSPDCASAFDLLRLADCRLIRAKSKGRDQVCSDDRPRTLRIASTSLP